MQLCLPVYSIFSLSFPEELPCAVMYQVLGSAKHQMEPTTDRLLTIGSQIKEAGRCEDSGMAVCIIALGKIGINLPSFYLKM